MGYKLKRNMKIVFLVGEFHPVIGGVGLATEHFCKALVKKGYKVYVITPRFKDEHPKYENYKKINIYRINCPQKYSLLLIFFLLNSFILIKKINPDIIYGEMLWTFGTISALLGKFYNKLSITHAHGSDIDDVRHWYEKLLAIFALKFNNYVFATNTEHKKKMLKWFKRKIFLLHNIVPKPRVLMSKKTIRQKLHLDQKKFHILAVGRLVKVKGIETKGISYAIKAMRNLNNCQLHIIGEGHLKNGFEQYVRNNNLGGKIFFYGKLPNKKVFEFMKACDALVFPSITEGLSMVFIEAMALKLPIIATRVGGAADIIKNEINGLFIPRKNSKAIEKKILQLKNNKKLRNRLSEAAYKTYLKFFTDKSVIKKFEEILSTKKRYK